MAIQGINTQSLGEKKSYDPLPDDSYTVSLNRVGEKSTKKGKFPKIGRMVNDFISFGS